MPHQIVRCALKRVIQNVILAATGLTGLVKVLPSILKMNMAPKTTRNSGGKEGTKMTRAGKDKGDPTRAIRRPVMTTLKLTVKNTTIASRDTKNDDIITPPLDTRGKDKVHPTITSFLAAGAQESFAEHIVPSLANSQPVIEAIPPGNSNERERVALNEINKSLAIGSQGDDGLSSGLVNSVATKKKEGAVSPSAKTDIKPSSLKSQLGERQLVTWVIQPLH
ncbi:hypothetical protein NDU88_001067 [Pleurodeles waltl]|uniref:Uncharacterized protein n=1 Tax=Pleurodeles waltl TaxID=8319 RepID=A0AAV7L9Y5_PLEWA|nr:hypothetical protein NDU88_001067 [Pleurodeles waltl]